jgi:hypothetical protein
MQEAAIGLIGESVLPPLFQGSLKRRRIRKKVTEQIVKSDFLAHLDSIAPLLEDFVNHNTRWLDTKDFVGLPAIPDGKSTLIPRFAEKVGEGQCKELFYYIGALAIQTGMAEKKMPVDEITWLEEEGLVMLLTLDHAKDAILEDYFKYARTTGFRDKDSGVVVPTIDVLNLTLVRQMVLILLIVPEEALKRLVEAA